MQRQVYCRLANSVFRCALYEIFLIILLLFGTAAPSAPEKVIMEFRQRGCATSLNSAVGRGAHPRPAVSQRENDSERPHAFSVTKTIMSEIADCGASPMAPKQPRLRGRETLGLDFIAFREDRSYSTPPPHSTVFGAPAAIQMVFISGEGGGAGSRLTKDVGNILAQLPETVEALTGGNSSKSMA